MDVSEEVTSSQTDVCYDSKPPSPDCSQSVQNASAEFEKSNKDPKVETDASKTSPNFALQGSDSTETLQTEKFEQSSKQDITAEDETPDNTAVETSAAPAAGVADSSVRPDSEPSSESAPGPTPTGGSDSCYRYEGDTCVYTDPSSGVEYVYSAESEGWVRRDGSAQSPVHAPTLENCYYVGEHYCFRDAAGVVYRLDPGSNSWEEWTPPADAAPAPAGGEAGEATGEKAAAGGEASAGTVSPAAAADAERCFRGADGAWCCRDDAGALCRWDAAAGRWVRADAAGSAAPRRGRPAGRKRRLNRGSSDDSEHDSDDEDESPPAKRTAANGDGRDDQGQEQEQEQEQQQKELGEEQEKEQEPPSDGSGYEWDAEKGAWFPKIDEEFLALHRLNYGFDSEGRAVETAPILETAAPAPEPPPEKQEAGKQRKLSTKKKPEWFQLDDSKNTKVYVTGLPEDTTEDEFVELMSKCGLVMKDPLKKNAWKIKLYRDDYGVPKGDAICTYIKIESVNLALSILDGYEFKGKTLSVEKATFDMKGKFDPSKKPKKRTLKKKDREKLQKKQEKLFAWQPDKIRGERERHERVVIVRNLFSPEEFKTRPEALLEYQQDLREECGKCGPVKKVVVHDRHKDGVAEVVFQEATDADSCVQKMNGRWFAGRQLEAATWDGKTKYRVEETEEERAERLAKWEQFISGEDKSAEDKPSGYASSESKPPDEKPPENPPPETEPA